MESRDLRVSLDLGVDRTEKDVTAVTMKEIMHVFMQIKVPALSVMYIFTVTIGLFPSLTVLLESMNKCKNSNRMSNDLYVPLFFLLFNLFDFCGRVSAGAFRPLFSAKNIWIPAVLRTVFIPLFLFCKISGSQLPILFHHDAYPILFMITMAISNGYIATLCMMHGASVTKPEDSYLAGTIMIFTLTLGLCFGACLSFIVIAISQGSV